MLRKKLQTEEHEGLDHGTFEEAKDFYDRVLAFYKG